MADLLPPDLLPPDVVVVEADPSMWTAPLTPVEEQDISGAAPGRMREFRAGRAAARAALAHFGIVDHDLVRLDDRRPVWPAGLVGSITHTSDYCAAAVASADRYVGIGLDAERLDRVIDGGVRDRICSERELHLARGVDHASHVIFSAKEAYFKTYYPATGHWIGFGDAEVTIDAPSRSFEVTLMTGDGPPTVGLTPLVGRYAVGAARVVTAIAAPVP